MATHSSALALRIPGTAGEPGGLPSMGSHKVRHDWSDLAAFLSWEIQKAIYPKRRKWLKDKFDDRQYACRWVPGLQVISPEFLLVSVLIWGCLGPLGDIWQWLKTLLVFTTWRGRRCFQHLEGRDQGCCWASCNTQDSSHKKKRIIQLPIVLGGRETLGEGMLYLCLLLVRVCLGTWTTWNGGSVPGLYF